MAQSTGIAWTQGLWKINLQWGSNIIKLQSHKYRGCCIASFLYQFKEGASFSLSSSHISAVGLPGWLGHFAGWLPLGIGIFTCFAIDSYTLYSSLETSHLNSLKSKNWLLQCQVSNSAAQLTALESPYQRQKYSALQQTLFSHRMAPVLSYCSKALQAFTCFWPQILLLICELLDN